jgi:hypothetical protein
MTNWSNPSNPISEADLLECVNKYPGGVRTKVLVRELFPYEEEDEHNDHVRSLVKFLVKFKKTGIVEDLGNHSGGSLWRITDLGKFKLREEYGHSIL